MKKTIIFKTISLTHILLILFIFNLYGCAGGHGGGGEGLLLSSTSTSSEASTAIGEATTARINDSPENIDDEKEREIALNKFVDLRFVSIRQDAAAGKGENLDVLADLLQQDKVEFGQWMQSNYDFLFNQLTSPQQLLERIDELKHS